MPADPLTWSRRVDEGGAAILPCWGRTCPAGSREVPVVLTVAAHLLREPAVNLRQVAFMACFEQHVAMRCRTACAETCQDAFLFLRVRPASAPERVVCCQGCCYSWVHFLLVVVGARTASPNPTGTLIFQFCMSWYCRHGSAAKQAVLTGVRAGCPALFFSHEDPAGAVLDQHQSWPHNSAS